MRTLRLKKNTPDYEKWEALLLKEGIKPEEPLDGALGIFVDDQLVATAARFRNIIKCVAIDSDYQGTSVFNELISGVYNEVMYAGFQNCYVYTKESAKDAFTHVGFKVIDHVDNSLYFMESGIQNIAKYLGYLIEQRVEGKKIAAIVMNANPFTNGHLYLATKAASENDVLHIFVVSEDVSVFPADIRFDLVKKGVAHLKNVCVHPTSNYIVSSATFPSYFLKETDDATEIQTRLDARIFKHFIAPTLGITVRYVGTEPHSPVTEVYNQAMIQEFNKKLKLKVIDREVVAGEVISASKVRTLLATGRMDEVEILVPPTTFAFLENERAKEIISVLQKKYN